MRTHDEKAFPAVEGGVHDYDQSVAGRDSLRIWWYQCWVILGTMTARV